MGKIYISFFLLSYRMCNHSPIVTSEYVVCSDCGEVLGPRLVSQPGRREPFHFGVNLGSEFLPRNGREKRLCKVDQSFLPQKRKNEFFQFALGLKSFFELTETQMNYIMAEFKGKVRKKEIFRILCKLVREGLLILDLKAVREYLGIREMIPFSLNKYESLFSYFPPSLEMIARKKFKELLPRVRFSPRVLIGSIYYSIVPGVTKKSAARKFQISRVYLV